MKRPLSQRRRHFKARVKAVLGLLGKRSRDDLNELAGTSGRRVVSGGGSWKCSLRSISPCVSPANGRDRADTRGAERRNCVVGRRHRRQRFGEAEVEDFDQTVARHEDVARFEIAMDDAGAMGTSDARRRFGLRDESPPGC
jgi:hypothetical protein